MVWPVGSSTVDSLREAICGPHIARTSLNDVSGLCPFLDGSPFVASMDAQTEVACPDILYPLGTMLECVIGFINSSYALLGERMGLPNHTRCSRRLPLVPGTSSSWILDINSHNAKDLAVYCCVVFSSQGFAASTRSKDVIRQGFPTDLSHKAPSIGAGSNLDTLTKYHHELLRSSNTLDSYNGEKGDFISLPCLSDQ